MKLRHCRKSIVWLLGLWCCAVVAAPRVVSLAPNITELVYAVGAGSNLVGVSAYSHYPPAAKALPVVANAQKIDIEKVLRLKPTVVFAWRGGTSPMSVAVLTKMGVPVVWLEFKKLADIPNAMRVIGHHTGHNKAAEHAAAQWQAHLLQLKHHYQARASQRITVVVQEGGQPLYVATGDSLQTQLLTLCGAQNVFAHLSGAARAVHVEQVLRQNPDVIVVLAHSDIAMWRRWSDLSAVRHGRVVYVPADLLLRPGPRMLEGARRLCVAVHS